MRKFICIYCLLLCVVQVLGKAKTLSEEKNVFIFTYFVDNGQDGVYLAASEDGIHFETINNGNPIMTPPQWKGQDLTRDPSIMYQDGLFRMVWTSHWNGDCFGYSESTDLTHWTNTTQVRPFSKNTLKEDLPTNIWAPEIQYNPFKKESFIIFSSTTPRERDNGDGSDNSGKNLTGYDNRMYVTCTKDGRRFTEAKLFFDQGFSTIDGVMRWDKKSNRWVMVIKNSRNADLEKRPGRNLCLTYTGKDLDKLSFTPASAPIAGTHSSLFRHSGLIESMAEGQCLLNYDNQWWLYWDEPAGYGMQLAVSKDLKTWNHIKDAYFPLHQGDINRFKAHHGTVIVVPRKAVQHLLNKELSPFSFSEVKLLDSWIKKRQESNIDYIKRLDADRLLHNFRLNAGISSNAVPLNGWEHPQVGLRGHFVGHYLSALSAWVAQTGDAELDKKLDYMVGSLAECQQKLGGKYLSAFPVNDFTTLEENSGGVWAPYYTYHKILQGMLDAYQYGGNCQALEVAKNMADFVEQRMDKLTAEQIERILYTRAANPTNEAGGMNDALYDLFRLTRENRYFKLASLFDREWFKKPLVNGTDQLSGLHANTHIVLVNGFARCHELTHDKDSRKAVENFYQMMKGHHSYINGTSSGPRPIPTTPTAVSAEHWGDAGALILTDKIAESCVTHNMQKLTGHLFEWTASPDYAEDFMNRYYNAVLPAKHSATSQTLYHLPLASGSTKKFLNEDDFRCCNGTGIEAYAQLTSGIYYHRNNEVWINNYVPSALSWHQEGFELEQHGDITKEEDVLLQINSAPKTPISIHCFIPHWAAEGSSLYINGKEIQLSGRGEYFTMTRQWKKGDKVCVRLKSDFRIEHLEGKEDIVAIYYGPSLLAFSAADEVILKGTEQDILNALSKKEAGGRFKMTNGDRTYELLPFFEVEGQPYACCVMIRNSAI